MRVFTKINVSSRLEDGNEITVSCNVADRPLNKKDYEKLIDKIEKKIKKNPEVKLYYTLRIKSNEYKDNWKSNDIGEIENQLSKIFKEVTA